MTDENPRAGAFRPVPDVPAAHRAEADDTADLPAMPGEAGDSDGRSAESRDDEEWGDKEWGDKEWGDEEWDEEPEVPPGKPAGRRRIPRITGALAVAILIGLGFLGGVVVQKNHDEKYTSGSAGGGLPALPEGFNPAALFGGASGGQAQTGSSGTSSTSASPIVIGEVVSVGKTSIVVRNISGKEITVALGSTRTYEKANSEPITSLKAGTNVVVSGRTAADGTATASTITSR